MRRRYLVDSPQAESRVNLLRWRVSVHGAWGVHFALVEVSQVAWASQFDGSNFALLPGPFVVLLDEDAGEVIVIIDQPAIPQSSGISNSRGVWSRPA